MIRTQRDSGRCACGGESVVKDTTDSRIFIEVCKLCGSVRTISWATHAPAPRYVVSPVTEPSLFDGA